MLSQARPRAVLSAILCTFALTGCGTFDSLIAGESNKPSARTGLIAQLAGGDNGARRSLKERDKQNLERLSDVDDPKVFYETAARISEQEHDHEAMVRHFANLTALEPTNTGYVSGLARSLRIVGRHEDSERVLRQALRDSPHHANLTEELGKTLLASGQLREGATMLEALANRPDLPATTVAGLRSAVGVAFDRSGNHKKARAQYRAALEADKLSTATLNNLGMSYTITGELDLAERALRRALVTPEASVQVRQNLAMVLALQGQTEAAKRLANQDLPPTLASDVIASYGSLADDGLFEDASAPARERQTRRR